MWRLKRTPIHGDPSRAQISPEPADTDEPESLRRQLAITEANLSEAKRTLDQKQKYIDALHIQVGDLRQTLRSALTASGNLAAVIEDRDRLDAANGVLVARVRALEYRVAQAQRGPLDAEVRA